MSSVCRLFDGESGPLRLKTLGQQAFLPGEAAQVGLRAGADVLDDLCGGKAAEAGAIGEVEAAGQAGEEAGRKQVARAGGVDDALDREGRNGPRLAARDDERPSAERVTTPSMLLPRAQRRQRRVGDPRSRRGSSARGCWRTGCRGCRRA